MFQFDSNDDNFDLDIDFTTLENIAQSKATEIQNETRPAMESSVHSGSKTWNLSPGQKENFVSGHLAKSGAVKPGPSTTGIRTTTPEATRGKPVKRPSPESDQQQPGCKQRFVRKFPGPAGIIALDANKVTSQENDVEPCRESNRLSDYETSEISWSRALDRLGIGFLKQDDLRYISKITASHSECRSLTTRVPFLIAAIKEIEHSSTDASCVLADMSGEVIGSFHQPLVDRYGKLLRKGSTLLLRNIALLWPSKSQRKMYLSITTRSLLAIYSPLEDKVMLAQTFTASDIRRWIAENPSGTSDEVQPRQLYRSSTAEASVLADAGEQTVTAPRISDDDVLAQFLSGADDELFTQF